MQLYGGHEGASEGPLAIVAQEIDTNTLGGSLDLSDFADLESFDTVTLSVGGEIYFSPELTAFVGQLKALGESTDGETATVDNVDIASWGPS